MRFSVTFVLFFCAVSFRAQPSTHLVGGVSLNEFVEKRLGQSAAFINSRLTLQNICAIDDDPIAARVFREYGAAFVAFDSVRMPSRCIFDTGSDVEEFQAGLDIEALDVAGIQIELQRPAARSLRSAIEDARAIGKRITPLDGAIAGKRSYSDTLRIWNSRFFRALDHWVFKGKITREEANYAVRLPIKAQIQRVIAWEAKGYFFSTNFSFSIFNSVAPPGTSQHLSLLAFDVVESSDPAIRLILNRHGWFQTIRSDEPHFTFIGVPESELPSRGLMPIRRGGRTYWVPNVIE